MGGIVNSARIPAVSGAATGINISTVMQLGSSDNLYFVALHNSGSNRTVTVRYKVTRLY